MVIKAVQDWWAQLFYTHSHKHRCTQTHTPVSFSGRVRGLWWESPPFPPFRRHEIFNGFAPCVCVWIWYCVCVWFDACVQVFLFDFAFVCAALRWRRVLHVCIYMCVYMFFFVCVCMCVLCVVCVRVHAWLSGLSQTAQNSLQSDISPAGDKWWLDERERWGLARISVSLRWRHIYTHTHPYTHTHTKCTHAHTHTLIHWQNTADTQNYQTRGWTLRDGQANLLIVQSCMCVLVCVSVHVRVHTHTFFTEVYRNT